MPIHNITNKHHLGIVSQCHQEDFRKRFRKKGEETESARSATGVRRNPFKITQHFIDKYNQAHGSTDQEKYEDLAGQFLNRCKRRAGCASVGEGKHVDLPVAWAELYLLSLCKGNVKNDALDALVVSLSHAPVHADQISALLHLAESILHFLCSDETDGWILMDHLNSCEIKMLQLGYLVYLRLFVFHLTGNLNGHQLSNINLHSLKGLWKCEARYQDFPNMLFVVHLMMRFGEVLCGLKLFKDNSVQITAEAQAHEVNQVLWLCLLSYHCVQNNATQLPQVIKQLKLLRDRLQQDNWTDCGLGLMILGEAAKSSMLCLQTLISLHMTQRQESTQLHKKEITSREGSWPWQLEHLYCSVLVDICLDSHCAGIKNKAFVSLLKQSHAEEWWVRYSVIQGLAQISRRAVLQKGLRNAAWCALQKHLNQEADPRVINAVEVIEGYKSVLENHREGIRGSGNPADVCVRAQSHWITCRLAQTLSQLWLPPAPVQLTTHSSNFQNRTRTSPPVKPRKQVVSVARAKGRAPDSATLQTCNKDGHKTPRQGKHKAACLDLRTRTDIELIKLVEDQWQKELKIMRENEEETEKTELEEKKKEEENIMKKRMEKVRKDTKPYELP